MQRYCLGDTRDRNTNIFEGSLAASPRFSDRSVERRTVLPDVGL
jgi:hypothetical protein